MSILEGKIIALLQGGPGSEREVSLASAKSVRAALTEGGGKVVDVDVRDGDFELPDPVDVAFNVIHGTFGEDGQIQEILEERGVPYTGAGVASSRLAFDKIESKKVFVDHGVPTPKFELLDLLIKERPRLFTPFVVKPPSEGSSVGVHIIEYPDDLLPALTDVRKYCETALIEDFVQGKELTVGVLGDEALPIVHICPKSGFYDMDNKYPWLNGDSGGGSDYICPAELGPESTRRVEEAALAAHRALEIEVYSRVDVLFSDDGAVHVLEVNTIPGMTETSLLPKAADVAGIDFICLCSKIVELSLKLRKP